MNKYNTGTILIVTYVVLLGINCLDGFSRNQILGLAAFGALHGWFLPKGEKVQHLLVWAGVYILASVAISLILQN